MSLVFYVQVIGVGEFPPSYTPTAGARIECFHLPLSHLPVENPYTPIHESLCQGHVQKVFSPRSGESGHLRRPAPLARSLSRGDFHDAKQAQVFQSKLRRSAPSQASP